MKLTVIFFGVAVTALAAGCGSSDSDDGLMGTGGGGGTPGGGASGTGGGSKGGAGGMAGAAATGGGQSGGTGGVATGGAGGGGGCSANGGTGGCGNDGTAWDPAWQAFECKVIELLNEKRAAGATCGTKEVLPTPPLARNQFLTDNARSHSEDMGKNGYFDLTTKDGTGPIDWSMKGYCGSYITAQIGTGQSDPGTFLTSQLKIESECLKLMSEYGKGAGVGYYSDPSGTSVHLWTLVVGSAP